MHPQRSHIIWLTALGQLLGSVIGVGGLVLCVHHHGEMELESAGHRACHEAVPDEVCCSDGPEEGPVLQHGGCGPCVDHPLIPWTWVDLTPDRSRVHLANAAAGTILDAVLGTGPSGEMVRSCGPMPIPPAPPPLEALRTVILLA